MKPSFRHFLGGMLLLALPLMLTSCEGEFDDIFGEWSRPSGQQNNEPPKPDDTPVAVSGVTIDQSTLSLAIDASAQLVATVLPADAANKSVSWSSSNAAVATVDANGNVKAVAAGTATITVTTTDGAKTATCAVTVAKKSGSIKYATSSIGKTFGDGTFTNELTNTGDGTVTYESSNTAVAEVNATTGEVTIKGDGDAIITATVTDTETYAYEAKTAKYTLGVGTATMTVTAPDVSVTYDKNAHGITVTAPADATIKYGTVEGTYDLDASPTYTDADTYTVYYQVTKFGFTTVPGSAKVVISKAAGEIKYADGSVTKNSIDTKFTNTLSDDGDAKTNNKVSYSSSETTVATIDADGEVTIVGAGTTTITATVTAEKNYHYATASAQYTLTVRPTSSIQNYNVVSTPLTW